ncbi:MAG: Fic family protein [Lachnospiraceae bacterium]|nr:Fic family protein [Lachnospiraceae bacterium]
MKKYTGMLKEYFILNDKASARKQAEELYNCISSISLNFRIGEHPAFIVYCDELLHELQEIRSINQKIWLVSGKLPPVALNQFLRQAVIEEIHQTNEMENIHSTRKEISDEMLVIQNGQKGKRFDGMIRKYDLIMHNEEIPMTACQDVRALYDSFILEEIEKDDPKDIPDGLFFRKGPVIIVKSGTTVHEGIFPESALNQSMEQALSFLNNTDYDPLIRIAAFHYLFGYIHPFYNGNGRMSRFISSYYLSIEKIHYLVSLRLSYVIKSHRSQYYSIFKTTNDSRNFGDLTLFVVQFLRFIREACEQVLTYLKEKNEIILHYQKILHFMDYEDHTKKLLFVLIQVSVCETESLSMKELESISKLSKYMIKKHLEQVNEFLIISHKRKAILYRANLQKLDTAST